MARHSVACGFLAGVCAFGPNGVAAFDDRQGAQLAAICTPCHNPKARGETLGPIVGMEAATLVGMLRAFRSAERPNHIMHAVSLSLSDEEIAVLADYLAFQGREAKQP